jgi:hypothetical protein
MYDTARTAGVSRSIIRRSGEVAIPAPKIPVARRKSMDDDIFHTYVLLRRPTGSERFGPVRAHLLRDVTTTECGYQGASATNAAVDGTGGEQAQERRSRRR